MRSFITWALTTSPSGGAQLASTGGNSGGVGVPGETSTGEEGDSLHTMTSTTGRTGGGVGDEGGELTKVGVNGCDGRTSVGEHGGVGERER